MAEVRDRARRADAALAEEPEARAAWEEGALRRALARAPERKARFTSPSDRPIPLLSTPLDLAELNYREDLGFPGEFPYTRGIHPTMYRARTWTMRLFAGFGTAEDTNRRFRYLLSRGQTGLSVAFHVPTLQGVDSDSERARGEVGKCGVAMDSLADMETLLEGIPLGEVSTSMTTNAPAAILWAMYLAVAEKQGVPWGRLRGTIQNDILKEYIAQKTWIFPPGPSLRLIGDTFEFAAREVPQWNPISISGYHIREAGATAVQELAFTLADGLEYVKLGVGRGLDVNEFVPRFSFFFDAHLDFFEEIAKYRAARRLWAREMKRRYNPSNPRALQLRFHCQTAGVTLTAQQPENNIVRVAWQALAGLLGGAQSLHTCALDETYALPTEEAATIALRTQQILLHESGAADVVDPLGGSYYLERLTDGLEEEAREYIRRIDGMGGMVAAIARGYPQREIINAAYRYQQQVEAGERAVVGVNKYASEAAPIPTLTITEDAEARQRERLRRLRAERDGAAVRRALDALKRGAEGRENLMPLLLDAVRAYATLGEIVGGLTEVFGEYQDPAEY
ncbi:MAG: methylmalonyl-CoA mutase [Nitrospinota bacterium]